MTAVPAVGPVAESGQGWGVVWDEDPQLRAARTDCFSVTFINCTCKWTHHAAAPGTSGLKGRSAERMRPSGPRATPSPRWTLQGASWELPGVQEGGRRLLKVRLPAWYSGWATLTLHRGMGPGAPSDEPEATRRASGRLDP